MACFAFGADDGLHGSFVARDEVEGGGFAEDDGLRVGEGEVVGGAHSASSDFFTDHVEEGDVVGGDGRGGDEFVDGDDLGRHAAFGVYGAAAEDGGVAWMVFIFGIFIWEEGWNLRGCNV